MSWNTLFRTAAAIAEVIDESNNCRLIRALEYDALCAEVVKDRTRMVRRMLSLGNADEQKSSGWVKDRMPINAPVQASHMHELQSDANPQLYHDKLGALPDIHSQLHGL